jgi:uncharacterized repeat protein (TIGR01451 family)
MSRTFALVFLCLLGLAYGQPNLKIIIDPFFNPANATEPFKIQVTCGPDGTYCDTANTAQLFATATQPGPWNDGQSPIGGERYHYLVIDNKQADYDANPSDHIEATYDQASRVRIATDPGIGGTYTLFWNGPGNNNLPCVSSMTSHCALDDTCCANSPGFTVGGLSATGGPVDLTNGGSQLGITLFQKASDHNTPIILRIWRADGKSVVLRKYLQELYVQRNILFLYRDFKSFPGDNLSDADIQSVIKNANAIAFQIYGAIALDAKITFLETVGIEMEKTLDNPCDPGMLFHPGDRLCWTVKIRNNAPVSVYNNATDPLEIFDLKDVEFVDSQFVGSALNLDRTSITVLPGRSGMTWDLHDKEGLDANLLRLTIHDFQPQDTLTLKFCAVIRTDYKSPDCVAEFCNFGQVIVPGFNIPPIKSNSTCVMIKYDAKINLNMNCPTRDQDANATATVIMNWSNTGNGPADNTKLTLVVSGAPPAGLNKGNPAWTCQENATNNTLTCTLAIGKVLPGGSGSVLFNLDLSVLTCPYDKLNIFSYISEECSNSSAVAQCSINVPHKVEFEIYKTAGSSSATPLEPGQDLTYTISYRNRGNFPGTGVYLLDTYDANTTPRMSANPGWTCDFVARVCRYNHPGGVLEAQSGIKTVTFTVTVNETIAQEVNTLCNDVTIYSDNSTVSNCFDVKSARVCVPVTPGVPDTGIIKRGVIGLMIYRISYRNKGSAVAENVILRESIPAGTTYVAAESDSRWVCNVGNECVLSLGTLDMGETGAVFFALAPIEDFTQLVSQCYNNTVTIAHDYAVPDPTPEDNIDSVALGNCGLAQFICPRKCDKCPDCVCDPKPCNCSSSASECVCPPSECTCAAQCCPQKSCDCPPIVCDKCEDCNCKCDNPCPMKHEDECKEYVTYEECKKDSSDYSDSSSDDHHGWKS